MVTITLGLIGSALGLLLTETTISVVVLIGLIMLAGIVVNNAIVLVDYINHLRRTEALPKIEAVLRAGELRFRPITSSMADSIATGGALGRRAAQRRSRTSCRARSPASDLRSTAA